MISRKTFRKYFHLFLAISISFPVLFYPTQEVAAIPRRASSPAKNDVWAKSDYYIIGYYHFN